MQERTCPECRASFTAGRPDKVYCSQRCKVNACHRRSRASKPAPERLCEHCGAPYWSKRTLKRFCSSDCGDAAYRLAHATERSEYERARYKQDKERRAAYLKAYRDERREHYRALRRSYAQTHQVERALLEHERRARKRGTGGAVSKADWFRMLNRMQRRCFYCRRRLDDVHMDHVVPLSRGGRHAIGNIVPACPGCNMSKGAKFVMEWRRS